jgi:hypothetical protein
MYEIDAPEWRMPLFEPSALLDLGSVQGELAPKELTRLFPDLWETKKATERWAVKNPPAAHRDD